jgi:hypothetical protein
VARRVAGTGFALTVLGVCVALAAAATPAFAACVEIWARGRQDPPQARRTAFKTNELFVVCIKLGKDAFVTLWDQPPKGDHERLWPNRFSHPADPTVRADKLPGGREHCFGGAGTAPMFFDAKDGVGEGKLSVHVTDTLEQQAATEDYAIPGRRVLRARMIEVTGKFASGAACEARMQEYLPYVVSQ